MRRDQLLELGLSILTDSKSTIPKYNNKISQGLMKKMAHTVISAHLLTQLLAIIDKPDIRIRYSFNKKEESIIAELVSLKKNEPVETFTLNILNKIQTNLLETLSSTLNDPSKNSFTLMNFRTILNALLNYKLIFQLGLPNFLLYNKIESKLLPVLFKMMGVELRLEQIIEQDETKKNDPLGSASKLLQSIRLNEYHSNTVYLSDIAESLPDWREGIILENWNPKKIAQDVINILEKFNNVLFDATIRTEFLIFPKKATIKLIKYKDTLTNLPRIESYNFQLITSIKESLPDYENISTTRDSFLKAFEEYRTVLNKSIIPSLPHSVDNKDCFNIIEQYCKSHSGIPIWRSENKPSHDSIRIYSTTKKPDPILNPAPQNLPLLEGFSNSSSTSSSSSTVISESDSTPQLSSIEQEQIQNSISDSSTRSLMSPSTSSTDFNLFTNTPQNGIQNWIVNFSAFFNQTTSTTSSPSSPNHESPTP